MLAELQSLFANCRPDATRDDYFSAIRDDNCLGKRTAATRKLSSQRLSELYALNPEVPLFRVIASVPALSVGSEADLMRTLEAAPLPAWKTRTDALPQQFSRVTIAAAKLLEPRTQRAHLSSGTLKSEKDVTDWLAVAEKDLLAKLKNGPIVIS